MPITLSQPRVLALATDLWRTWWQGAPVTYPNFLIELHYLDFFIHVLQEMETEPEANVIPVMRSMLEIALEKSCNDIERQYDKPGSDDASIQEAVSGRRLILRKQWVAYNSRAQDMQPALPKELWEDYNHWLLALTLWNGFVRSFEASFTVHLPEDAYDPDDVLLLEANKPLWGMWVAFEELGRTFISTANNHQSFSIYPFVSWKRYRVG
jgi:hypothetical protein